MILFCDLPLSYDATRKDQIMLFSGGTGKYKEVFIWSNVKDFPMDANCSSGFI